MAWYNPQRVDFAPNLGIIQSAGAVGNYAKDWSDGLYAKRMKAQDRQDTLDWRDTQTEQWNKNFDAQQQQNEISNAYRDTTLGATLEQQDWSRKHQTDTFNQNVLHQNRTFDAQQEANRLAQEKLAQEEARKAQAESIYGMHIAQQYPEFAQQVGALNTETTYGKPIEVRQTNPIIASLLGRDPNKSYATPELDVSTGMSMANPQTRTTINNDIIRALGASGIKPDSTKDPLAKERATHAELLRSGRTNLPFGDWMADGGTSNIKLKSESVTKARDKATEQTTAMDNLINQMLYQYNPSKRGFIQGTGQAIQELIPIFHTKESAQLESAREAMVMNLATALNGGRPSNADQQIARNIIGGAWQNESGAAAKIVEVLEQGINGLERTINQIETAGGDTTELRNKINEYKQRQEQAKKWDGSTRFNPNATNQAKPTVRPKFGEQVNRDLSNLSTEELIQAYQRGVR